MAEARVAEKPAARPAAGRQRPARLTARSVSKLFWVDDEPDPTIALQGVSLTIGDGEFVCIVGPSGCGKTTFLNMVAGLLPVDEGTIDIGGKRVDGPGRDRAVVFQQARLLPWRSTFDNVMYGMQLHRRLRPEEMRKRAQDLVDLVGLSGFERRHPAQLSGGMQQRVNLARALATDPEILLMDEPFAALDAQTREFMQAELLRIWHEASKTVLFVTHQIDEAIYLADRVMVFGTRPGRLRAEFEVPFERPRPLSIKRHPEFLALTDRIWALIEEEAARIGLVQTVSQAETRS